MALTLVTRSASTPEVLRQTMSGDRLTVGRGSDNDLVLEDPDRILSKRHCVLERRGQDYILADTSTNGTFLNYQPEPLGTAPAQLSHGDVILLGEFELVVEIKATLVAERPVTLPPLEPQERTNTANHALTPAADPLADAHDADGDFLNALLSEPAPGHAPFDAGASAPNHSPATHDHYDPPRVAGRMIPDDWEDSIVAGLPQRGAPATTPPPAPPTDAPDTALQAFLSGLGMETMQIPPQDAPAVMAQAGRVMAAMISGLRDILMTRAALKSEMRMARTMIQADRNNPMKFSICDAQAIEAMIRPSMPGFQEPETAVAEVMRDLKAHEVATISGMEAALKDLLTQLGPKELSARIEETSGLGSFLVNKKARSWEAYERHYAQIARQTEDDFQSTFGKEFARAYEAQIKKL